MTYQEARQNVLVTQSEVIRLNDRLCNMHRHWIENSLCDSVETLTKQHDIAVAKWVEAKAVMASFL